MFSSAVIKFTIFLILQSVASKGEDQPSQMLPQPSTQEPVVPLNAIIDNICDNNLWRIACSVYEKTSDYALLVASSMHCFGLSSFSYSSTTFNAICESLNTTATDYNSYLWTAACAVYQETSYTQLITSYTMSSFHMNSFSYNSGTLDAICDWNNGSRVEYINICDNTWTTACAIYRETGDSRPLVGYAMNALNLRSFSYNDNILNIMCESGVLEVSNDNCHNSWKVACAYYNETTSTDVLVSHIMASYQISSFTYSDTVLNTICNSIIENREGCQTILTLKHRESHLSSCTFNPYRNIIWENDKLSGVHDIPHTPEWQVIVNMTTPIGEPNILETDTEHDRENPKSAFAQSLHCLEPGHSYFKIQILSMKNRFDWITVGLNCNASSNEPGWDGEYIACRNSGSLTINRKSKYIGAKWKTGDIITCGIQFSSDFESNGGLIKVYFLVNQRMTMEKMMKMPSGGFFPTIAMSVTGTKVRYLNK